MKKSIISASVSSLLVTVILISITITFCENTTVNAAESPYITNGAIYYIKNVNSGKYLSLPDSSTNTTNGTRVIQDKFFKANRQKWYVNYISSGTYGGFYKISSYIDSSKALEMESASGENNIYVQINSLTATTKQCFKLTDIGSTAHVIYTNSSNCIKALMVKNSSISNGTQIYQRSYTTNLHSAEWLFEPVNGYDVTNALSYAVANKNNRVSAYPNLNGFTRNSENDPNAYYKFVSESTNYISQCLAAGGKHYNYSQIVTKKNTGYSNPTDPSQLVDSWSLTISNCPWLDSNQFYDHWKIGQTTNNYSLSDIINNTGNASSGSYGIGDVVLFQSLYSELGNEYITDYVVYVTATPTPSDKGSYTAVFHNWGGFTYTATIRQLCQNYAQNNGTRRVVFMNF